MENFLSEWNSLSEYFGVIPAEIKLRAPHVPDLFLLKAGSMEPTRALVVELGYRSSLWIQLDRTDPKIADVVCSPFEELYGRLDCALPALSGRVRAILEAYKERRSSHEVSNKFWAELMAALDG